MDTRVDESVALPAMLAVQLGFATPEQVKEALREGNTEKSFLQNLRRVGTLDDTQQATLEQISFRIVQMHEGDPRETLAALCGSSPWNTHLVSSLLEQAPVSAESEVVPHLMLESPGRYTLGPEHGHGGQSRIFIAEDAVIGRQVAFKELLPGKRKSKGTAPVTEATLRFLREARVTGRLEHPNIVPVYEIGRRMDGSLYYTMKLVGGKTLAESIQERPTYRERRQLLSHVADLCHAVAYAHSRGIIHRDIKPGNVMVGEFGETVVLDWGLAKARGLTDVPAPEDPREVAVGETMAGTIMGTPSYMSPEQASGELEKIDEQSDVWGLGAVLYEVLTGKPPVEGQDLMEIILKLVNNPEIEPVRHLCPEAPPELAAIARRALQADKSKRYGSAQEMARELEAFQSGERVAAYEYSGWELLRRFVQRNRVPVAIGVAAAVLLAVVSLWAVVRIEHERDQALEARLQAEDFAVQMIFDLADGLSTISGADEVRQKLVSSAVDYYGSRIDVHHGDRQRRLQLATAFLRIAGVADEVGQTRQAAWARSQAQGILAELHMAAPSLPPRTHVARVETPKAAPPAPSGPPRLAVAVPPARATAPASPPPPSATPIVLYVWPKGSVEPPTSQPTPIPVASTAPPAELKMYDDYLSLLPMQQKLAHDDRSPQAQLNLAGTCLELGRLEIALRNLPAAEGHLNMALGLCNAEPTNPRAQKYAVQAYELLADAAPPGEAPHYLELGLQTAGTLADRNPEDLRSQLDHATLLGMAGRNDEAYSILAWLFSDHPQETEVARRLTLAALATGHDEVALQADRAWMNGSDRPVDRVLQNACAAAAVYLEGKIPDAVAYVNAARTAAASLGGGFTSSFTGMLAGLKARVEPGSPEVVHLFSDLEASRQAGDAAPQRIREALNAFMLHVGG